MTNQQRPDDLHPASLEAHIDDILDDEGDVLEMEEDRDANTSDKPTLKLIGTDGNAFALLGKAKRAANNAGWSEAKWKEVQNEAMSGDYDHLLQTLITHFEVS